MGRPVISSHIAGIPELVENEVNGWLVPAGSVECLATALGRAPATSPERLSEMGRAGAAWCCAKSRRHAGGHPARLALSRVRRLSGRERPRMILVADVLLYIATLVCLVPLTVLIVESLAALLPARRRQSQPATDRPGCVILIPAHDEEAGIAPTLAALQQQRGPQDRIVVVADNCTDRTAEVARECGAEALIRQDPDRRGKGYALEFAFRQLATFGSPEIVVIVDADCIVEAGCLEALLDAATAGEPVQGRYLMEAPATLGPRGQLMAPGVLVQERGPAARSRPSRPALPSHRQRHGPAHAASGPQRRRSGEPRRGHAMVRGPCPRRPPGSILCQRSVAQLAAGGSPRRRQQHTRAGSMGTCARSYLRCRA